jgi:general stress protein YciG
MGTSNRGFASMDPSKQREIASKGGRAAHQKGTAHQWTSEEARAAGRKGGERRGTSSINSTQINATQSNEILSNMSQNSHGVNSQAM